MTGSMITNKMPRKQFFFISGLIFLLLMLGCLRLSSIITHASGMTNINDEGKVKLEIFVTYLQGVLKAYESLPELLATDSNLVSALQNPNQDQRIAKLNRYLETINSISDTADTYLMDKEGLTIAASNWQEERPFVGRNFSFRPYFVEAMQGQLGRYFALGTTSSKRGYYFAYPVRKGGEILGVVVIKINIDSVEKAWEHKGDSFLVTDPEGVVFITTRPEWRYKTIRPLAENIKRQIIESQRYPNATLDEFSKVKKIFGSEKQLVQVASSDTKRDSDHLLLTRHMPEAGWNVHFITDTKVVGARVFWVNVTVGSVLTLSYMLILLLMQRKYRLAELGRIREKNRLALQEANEQLEIRVHERTRELTEINKLLRREIQDRQRTEATLKKTRSELIHAAKMAVLGQMSAGINHELNQPLAAIRSYTDNGKQFLKKGRLDEAMWNLDHIGELTERMAQIGVQLKLFSRKSSGQMGVVPLHGVVDGALEILRPSMRKTDVHIHVDLKPEAIKVRANNVLMQQVLVNLLGNAIQAVEGRDTQNVRLTARVINSKVFIIIKDSGTGVKKEDASHIFEPFFTTKKTGQGLGLGLTISERILQEMRGRIRLAESSENGSSFEITLDEA